MAEFEDQNEREDYRKLHNILANLRGEDFLNNFPVPLEGQSREEYLEIANLHMKPMVLGLPQAIDDVGALMELAVLGQPQYEKIVPELVRALRAGGRVIINAVPGMISTISLFKFQLLKPDDFDILLTSFRNSISAGGEMIRSLVNIAVILQQELHAQRLPDFPMDPRVAELPPDAPVELVLETIGAMRAQEEAINAQDIAEGKKADYTLYYALSGLAIVGITGLAYAVSAFGTTAAPSKNAPRQSKGAAKAGSAANFAATERAFSGVSAILQKKHKKCN